MVWGLQYGQDRQNALKIYLRIYLDVISFHIHTYYPFLSFVLSSSLGFKCAKTILDILWFFSFSYLDKELFSLPNLQRFEFIKENMKVRKQENKNSTKKAIKKTRTRPRKRRKKILFFLITFLVRFLFSFFFSFFL